MDGGFGKHDQLLGEMFHDYLVLLAKAHNVELIQKAEQIFGEFRIPIPSPSIDK